MINATDNNSFGPRLTGINKLRKRIVYIIYDIIFLF